MYTFHKTFAVGALLGALGTWGFVSSRPTPEERGDALLQRQVDLLIDDDARMETVAELRALNPEWDLMHRTFLALSMVDRALAHPEEADHWLPMIDGLVQSEIDDADAHGQRWFLMDYANAAPFRDESGRSVFVDGEIALVLGARRFVRDGGAVALAHRERVEALVAQFERSPGLVPESYPDEAWLFCNTNALVAIRMADVLDGTDHHDLIDRWV